MKKPIRPPAGVSRDSSETRVIRSAPLDLEFSERVAAYLDGNGNGHRRPTARPEGGSEAPRRRDLVEWIEEYFAEEHPDDGHSGNGRVPPGPASALVARLQREAKTWADRPRRTRRPGPEQSGQIVDGPGGS